MPDAISLPQFLALIYADIFDYPLTIEETTKYALNPQSLPAGILNKFADSALFEFETNGEYLCLKNRQSILGNRRKREVISQKKLLLAKELIKPLQKIPTITAIFLTGSVAIGNSNEEDDIDLLIITKAKTIWITRLLSILLLDLKGNRRKFNNPNYKNKLCLNMFIDENFLKLPSQMRNLYTAHELIYVLPIFDKNNIAKKILSQNQWVSDYLTNFNKTKDLNNLSIIKEDYSNKFFSFVLGLLNPLSRFIEKKYMKNRVTSEVINDTLLGFHPLDNWSKIERLFNERINKLT